MKILMICGCSFLHPNCSEILHFSARDAFWLYFGPQVASELHWDLKMITKGTLGDHKFMETFKRKTALI